MNRRMWIVTEHIQTAYVNMAVDRTSMKFDTGTKPQVRGVEVLVACHCRYSQL